MSKDQWISALTCAIVFLLCVVAFQSAALASLVRMLPGQPPLPRWVPAWLRDAK
jgi:hypothetical protein